MRQQMTGFQLGCLMALYSQVAQLLFLPTVMAQLAGRDAWLAVLAGGAGGLPVVMATWAVASRYPGVSLAQAARYLLGKWAGGLVGILCWAFFLFLCSLVVRNLMDSIGMAILPGTPHLAIGGLILGLAVYAIYNGVEVLGHLSGFLAVSYIAGVSAVFLLLVDEIRLGHLLPVLLPGPGPVLRAAWPSVGWFGEALIFGFLLPYLQNPARDGRWALYGYSLAVAILAVVASLCTTVFGPELTARLSYPTYALVQQIRIGEFLERTEIVLVGIWIMGMFVKVGLCLLAAGLAARHSAGIPFTPWSVAAQAIAALALTQLWPSFNSQASWAVSGLTPTVLPIQLGIPLLLLAVGGLRGWPVPNRNRKDRASHELG